MKTFQQRKKIKKSKTFQQRNELKKEKKILN